MKLKNILDDKPCYITYRTNTQKENDIMTGFCLWNGKELKSGDNDSYSIEDEIEKYELDPAGDFTVWIKSEWIGDIL